MATWMESSGTVTQCIDMSCGSEQLDKKHVVELTIPASLFPNNQLKFEFRVETSEGIETESAPPH